MVDEQELTLASTVQNVTTTALPAPATSMVPICYEFLQGLLAHLFQLPLYPRSTLLNRSLGGLWHKLLSPEGFIATGTHTTFNPNCHTMSLGSFLPVSYHHWSIILVCCYLCPIRPGLAPRPTSQ
jgi:hypothetical protein